MKTKWMCMILMLAFSGLQGLYLYDISSRKVRAILNYYEEGMADNMQIATGKKYPYGKCSGQQQRLFHACSSDIDFR